MLNKYIASILLLNILLIAACSRAVAPDVERGSMYQFRDGYPELRVSTIGLLDIDDTGYINIAADVVYGSLIYRNLEGKAFANVVIETRVVGVDNPDFSKTEQTSLQIENQDQSILSRQNTFAFEQDVEVPPGEYEITVTLFDQTSGKSTVRNSTAFIPDPENPVTNLTAIRLLGKNNLSADGRFMPITTYDVTSRVDSLKFVFQVTNNRMQDPLTIRTRLIRYESDDTPARDMHLNNYTASSIQYKGVDYTRAEIIEETRRILDQEGSVLIEYQYEFLPSGNYRFEATTEGGGIEPLFKGRDFSVKPENYPSIQSPYELAAPLAYLMDRREYESLMSIEDPDEMKEAIDRFWLTNVGSINRARRVISMYYERVEEANKQFSSFKEGWKTDMGMIYILFGPPWYIDQQLNLVMWSYAFDRSDPRYNFIFEQPRIRNDFFPFTNYLLERNQNLYQIQYQQVQLWLSGEIVNRNI
jgi:GWxTD domain-containing protein